MKALILAAGFGTRLLPYTKVRPKPLFTINDQPVLHRLIIRLIEAGCRSIVINTHHLHEQVENFIKRQHYPIPVATRYEPVILGTGGAIRNIADWLDSRPFFVINSDVVTDLDLMGLYEFHLRHAHPATLVMHSHEAFNSVAVDAAGMIRNFYPGETADEQAVDGQTAGGHNRLAFTGIQVLDPGVIEAIPEKGAASSIDVYQSLLERGIGIAAYIPDRFYWQDIGSPGRYRSAVYDEMAPEAFASAFRIRPEPSAIQWKKLAGDGSDRTWYRLLSDECSLILSDHGIQTQALAEVDSFIAIGRHLLKQGINVPEIYLHDRFSGMVFLEDLGDTLLYDRLQEEPDEKEILRIYQAAIETMIRMSVTGARDFDPAVCYQSPQYDQDLILEKECCYFVKAFLRGCLQLSVDAQSLAPEFSHLADLAVENGIYGFMHRDLQSRNIMLYKKTLYLIDFQAGRMGPIQYDLAALLADPYAGLPEHLQEKLLSHAMTTLAAYRAFDQRQFLDGYAACRLTRSLQTAGAFGYLSTVKAKPFFRQFIPRVLHNLRTQLSAMPDRFPVLASSVEAAGRRAPAVLSRDLDV